MGQAVRQDIDINRLIDDFGGVNRLQQLLEHHFPDYRVSRAAIYKWRARGSLPFNQVQRLIRLSNVVGRAFQVEDYLLNRAEVHAGPVQPLRLIDVSMRPMQQGLAPSLSERNRLALIRQLMRQGMDVIEVAPAHDMAHDHDIQVLLGNAAVEVDTCLSSALDEHAVLWAAQWFGGRRRGWVRIDFTRSDFDPARLTIAGHCLHLLQSLGLQADLMVPVDMLDDEDVMTALAKCVRQGARRITLHDAGLHWIPETWARSVRIALQQFGMEEGDGGIAIAVACHDGHGLSLANTLAAIRAGATHAACTFIGEHAASAVALHAALSAHDSLYRRTTRFDAGLWAATCRLVTSLTGDVRQATRAHGVADAVPQRQPVGPIAGRKAFRQKLASLGIEFDSEVMLNTAFAHFRDLEARKRTVFDDDLQALLVDLDPAGEPIQLVSHYAVSETGEPPLARLRLRVQQAGIGSAHGQGAGASVSDEGAELDTEASGSGVVDAAFRALENVLQTGARLVQYSLNALTEGTDSQAEALIRLECGGRSFCGLGTDTDVLLASIKAYLAASNRMVEADMLDLTHIMSRCGEVTTS